MPDHQHGLQVRRLVQVINEQDTVASNKSPYGGACGRGAVATALLVSYWYFSGKLGY